MEFVLSRASLPVKSRIVAPHHQHPRGVVLTPEHLSVTAAVGPIVRKEVIELTPRNGVGPIPLLAVLICRGDRGTEKPRGAYEAGDGDGNEPS